MTTPSHLDLFRTEGHRQAVEGNCPLRLNEPQGVWLVDSEWVELFAVPLRDGEPVGARIHLGRFEAGQLLFAVPEARWGLVAVGLPGSTAIRLTQPRLQQWAAEHQSDGSVQAMVENWVERLTAGVARDDFPIRCF